MEKTIFLLPDGTELSSGEYGGLAIMQVTLTDCVNAEQDLTLGAVCANMLEATVWAPGGSLSLEVGSEVTVFREDTAGNRRCKGIYRLEKPQQKSQNTYRITAYDRIVRLDKDLSDWLAGLDGWPYSLGEFGQMVCQACGLVLISEDIPNGEYPVEQFSAAGITGRQLMHWVAEACARFCRAKARGEVELAWYEPAELRITPGGEAFYFQDTLQYADYSVEPVEKVQICWEETDIGGVYPNVQGEKNTYRILANPLLTANTSAQLVSAAQEIYRQLEGFSYTPCTVCVPAETSVEAGERVQITDANGRKLTVCIMCKVTQGQKAVLSCTGNKRRDSSAAVHQMTYRALSGKILCLQQGVEGLRIENRDAAQRMAAMEITVDGLSTEVSSVSEKQIGQAAGQTAQVQFSAMGGTGIAAVAELKARQSGDGEPSPQNICLITGIDSLDVTVCGEITDSNAEGYHGQTETVRLPSTSYGGYVDWARGKYVQTHESLVFDGTEKWVNDGAVRSFYCYGYLIRPKRYKASVCSHYQSYWKYWTNADKEGLYVGSVENHSTDWLEFLTGFESIDMWKAYLAEQYAAGTPVTVVYEMTEPIEHHLGVLPALIARDGINHVFHNGNGGITVSFNHDYALHPAIGMLENRIVTAETSITQSAEQIALRATKTEVNTAKSEAISAASADAAAKADAAEAAAKADTTEKLKAYSTTVEMNSAIEQKADSITLSVSQSYATASDLRNTIADLETETDGKYATKTDTKTIQDQLNHVTKFLKFDGNGVTIGETGSPAKVVIDNDKIRIEVNGKAVQEFDADGNAIVPMLSVNEKLNLLGLEVQADDTHIHFDILG